MKKDGFIATSLLYSFFLVFCALLLALVATFLHNRLLLNNLTNNVKKELSNINNRTASNLEIGEYVKMSLFSNERSINLSNKLWIVASKNSSTISLVSAYSLFNTDKHANATIMQQELNLYYGLYTAKDSITFLTKKQINDFYNEIDETIKNALLDYKNEYIYFNNEIASPRLYLRKNCHTTNCEFINPLVANKQYPIRIVVNVNNNAPIQGGKGTINDPYNFAGDASLLNEKILTQYGGESNILMAPASIFTTVNTSTENKMHKMDDDYGTSYYYRGAKDYVNNNIIFAEHQWKIVRINGDGSIRIIYNGTCPNNSCTINSTGSVTQMGLSKFNPYDNDNKYVGYMYGGAAGSASTSKTQANTNQTNSTIKTYLDTWYLNNILNKGYHSHISDTLFCNDRQLQSEVGGAATGTGFGTSPTDYAARYRLDTTKNPNIKCTQKNDRFTVSDTVKGNGALIYPIGLLTPDEAAIAGLKSATSNSTNYLYTNQYWWTIGPSVWSSGTADAWNVTSSGGLYYGDYVNISYGVRGVLNLKSGTQAIGIGTTTDPFKVV